MIRGIFVGTDGSIEAKEYDSSRPLHRVLQEDIGGGIERVNPRGLDQGFIFFCHEEGKLGGLYINPIGTVLYENPDDYIAGNIVVMKEAMTSEGIDCVSMSIHEQWEVIKHLQMIRFKIDLLNNAKTKMEGSENVE